MSRRSTCRRVPRARKRSHKGTAILSVHHSTIFLACLRSISPPHALLHDPNRPPTHSTPPNRRESPVCTAACRFAHRNTRIARTETPQRTRKLVSRVRQMETKNMSWKREYFKRRIRELAGRDHSEGRAYISLQEAENDLPHSFDHVWQCLSKAWVAGRAMGKSPLMLQDEAEEWLSGIGVRQPRVVSQAFIDARVGDRAWNSKCEMCRFAIANVVLNASEQRAERDDEHTCPVSLVCHFSAPPL